MKLSRFTAILLCLTVALISTGAARAAEALRLEALLIWGTDDAKSPDPNHKPIDAVLAGRLAKSPYRWKHYFEVNRQIVEIPLDQTRKGISMSSLCKLDIKNLGKGRVEVKLYGKGKLVSTQKNELPPLVLAGDAGNNTAWMVVIRAAPTEPAAKK